MLCLLFFVLTVATKAHACTHTCSWEASDQLPAATDHLVKFHLYTTETGLAHPKAISVNNFTDAYFDTEKTYTILCYGYLVNETIPWYSRTIQEYLKTSTHNVITVDYVRAYGQIYMYASTIGHTVNQIAEKIGELLINIKEMKHIPYENMHIIGHSIGAHIAGSTGNFVTERSPGEKIGRITALDPESILHLQIKYCIRSLSSEDAHFVDAIDTSSPLNLDLLYGGAEHPGCKPNDILCAHNIAPIIFYESINNKELMSKACSSKQMGDHVDLRTAGIDCLKASSYYAESYYAQKKK